jgi:hypothetical protein
VRERKARRDPFTLLFSVSGFSALSDAATSLKYFTWRIGASHYICIGTRRARANGHPWSLISPPLLDSRLGRFPLRPIRA